MIVVILLSCLLVGNAWKAMPKCKHTTTFVGQDLKNNIIGCPVTHFIPSEKDFCDARDISGWQDYFIKKVKSYVAFKMEKLYWNGWYAVTGVEREITSTNWTVITVTGEDVSYNGEIIYADDDRVNDFPGQLRIVLRGGEVKSSRKECVLDLEPPTAATNSTSESPEIETSYGWLQALALVIEILAFY